MKNDTTKLNLKLQITLFVLLLVQAPGLAQEVNPSSIEKSTGNLEVRLASEIDWQALNPARGDASPQAGTLWGDQTKDEASGFLVKFVDGFSSPPHIHNITYRGIVIGGGLHNDDPDAEAMWMKPGSYWTQPAGEVHITSARGASVCYVEIQSGPYLVKPPAAAFDNGERPVNVETDNIVWLDASDTIWIEGEADTDTSKNVALTFLWGELENGKLNGSLVKLPAGFAGKLMSSNSTLKVVVIKGQLYLDENQGGDKAALSAGSYFGGDAADGFRLNCERECTVYVRATGEYTIVPE